MYPIDAATERFEAVEILGIPGLFTTQRVNRATVPKGMYAYELQTSADDWSQPCLLARHITVAHFGTVLTASPIALFTLTPCATRYRYAISRWSCAPVNFPYFCISCKTHRLS